MSENEVMSIADIKRKMAEDAAKEAAENKVSGAQSLSIKGSKFKLGDDVLGKELTVVMAAIVNEFSYYDGIYDPNNYSPPACFALGDLDNMVPHATAPNTQSASCDVCWANKFGSKGKGKACKNAKRILVMPINDGRVVFKDAVVLKVPPTSLSSLGNYINKVAKRGAPSYSIMTKIGFEEDSDWPKLTFEPEGNFINEEDLVEIYNEQSTYVEMLSVPFNVEDYKAPEQASERGEGRSKLS